MNRKHRGVFYGWWVVLTAAVGLFWGAPVSVYSFSVFLKPLMQNFHAGRAAVSLAFTLGGTAGAFSSPLMGWLIDRYGARRVILPSAAMFGFVLIAMQAASGQLWHLYVFYGALGLFVHGLGPIPYGKVISHWFDGRRGLALGLMMLGIGAGAIFMPPFAQQLITRFGWRAAYAILGCLVLLIPMPVTAAFLKEKPQELALLPDGPRRADSGVAAETDTLGSSVHEAGHNKSFWIMLIAFFLVSASVQGCLVHLAAMLTDGGVTLQAAALGSSAMGAAVLIGRVGTGYLLDLFFAPRVAALLFGSTAFGIGLLWMADGTTIMFAGACLTGLGLGAEVDIIAYLTSRYFGLGSFGKLYSFAFGAFVLAGAMGPLAMGAGFDLTASYRAPLAAFCIAALVASVLMTRLGPYRFAPRPALNSEAIPSLAS